jgi:hypothetical protein
MRHDESTDHEKNGNTEKIRINRSRDDVTRVIEGDCERRQSTQKLDVDDHWPVNL